MTGSQGPLSPYFLFQQCVGIAYTCWINEEKYQKLCDGRCSHLVVQRVARREQPHVTDVNAWWSGYWEEGSKDRIKLVFSHVKKLIGAKTGDREAKDTEGAKAPEAEERRRKET